VYSVTDRNSFNHLEKWLEELTSNADPGILVMLVGNKSDLESARQVSTQEGKGTISINLRYIRRKKLNSDII
jgi:GTPase SAR1 family protein